MHCSKLLSTSISETSRLRWCSLHMELYHQPPDNYISWWIISHQHYLPETTYRPMKDLCIINVYMSCRGSAQREHNFRESLDELYELHTKFSVNHHVILCGDMNASLFNIRCTRDNLFQNWIKNTGLFCLQNSQETQPTITITAWMPPPLITSLPLPTHCWHYTWCGHIRPELKYLATQPSDTEHFNRIFPPSPINTLPISPVKKHMRDIFFKVI